MNERESTYTRLVEASPEMLRLVGAARGNNLVESVVLNIYPQIKDHPRFGEFLTKLESTGRTGIDLYRSLLKFNHYIADVYRSAGEYLPQNMAEGYLNAILEDDLAFEKWVVGQADDREYQKRLREETDLLHDLLATPPKSK